MNIPKIWRFINVKLVDTKKINNLLVYTTRSKMIKRRLEMGEEAWAEYQKQRKNKKADAWRSRNVERAVYQKSV